jgi:hypothetical protein
MVPTRKCSGVGVVVVQSPRSEAQEWVGFIQLASVNFLGSDTYRIT